MFDYSHPPCHPVNCLSTSFLSSKEKVVEAQKSKQRLCLTYLKYLTLFSRGYPVLTIVATANTCYDFINRNIEFKGGR